MIYQKLQKARQIIKDMPLKKAGHNKFSNYDYFQPEQISQLVHEAEKQTGLIHIFSLMRDCNGLHGELEIRDVETNEFINFSQATEVPLITATNAAQQIGGAVTYTLRYMLMTAYDIADNSLDFDAKDNRELSKPANLGELPEKAKVKITEKAFNQLCDKLKAANGKPIEIGDLLTKARKYYLPFTNDQENIINQIID
jgi:hypothetical protein